MKRIFLLATLSFCFFTSFGQNSSQATTPIPINVNISDLSSNIPAASQNFMTSRLKAAVARNGMGATDDFSQFYMSCSYTVLDRHIMPGSPTKYYDTVEMNFFVIDSFAGKEFSNTTIETKGVGNSEEQAATAGIRQLSPSNPVLSKFIKESSRAILNYYNAQYKNIISKALSLAKVYKYEEALFQLSMVPEACVGYQEVLNVASGIYQKYLDDKANRALAKARAIWNAGMNAEAAAEAAQYLAEITPDDTCYPEAISLSNEMKERVKSDIDYYRKRDEKAEERAHQEAMATISAWKAIGVAYGNNQKSNYYKSLF